MTVDWNTLAHDMAMMEWDTIHQSDLGVGRRCRKELAFYLASGRRSTGTMQALLGSAFHRLVNVCYENNFTKEQMMSIQMDVIRDCAFHVFERDPVVPWQGRRAEHLDLMLLMTRQIQGLTLLDLAYRVLDAIEAEGMTIKAQEVKFRYGPMEGTIDLGCHLMGEVAIGDLKSSSLWDPWVKNGSVKKQTWTEDQVRWFPQLRHYHFLYTSVTGRPVKYYFILTPANLTTYTRGSKKGSPRGETIHLVEAPSLEGYEEDLFRWVKSFLDSQPRDYPQNFGKPSCPTCRWFGPCLKGSNQTSGEEYDDE